MYENARLVIISIITFMVSDYILFISLYSKKSKLQNIIIGFVLLLITFLIKAFTSQFLHSPELGDYIYMYIMYKLFSHEKQDFTCMNLLLFGDIISTVIHLLFTSVRGYFTGGTLYLNDALMQVVIVVGVFIISYFLLRKIYKTEWYNDLKEVLPWILSGVIITFLLEAFLIDRINFNEPSLRVVMVVVTHIILFIVITFLIVYLRYFLKQKYHHEYQELRIEELKKYNDTISSHQEKIRKFKHDYKNLLLVANSLLEMGRYEELQTYFQELTTYSEKYLQQDIDALQDIRNVQHLALRQVLVEKINKISMSGIKCIFECRDIVEKINIPSVELVRVVGILLDNALEAARESQEKIIEMVILSDNGNFEFEIRNSTVALEHRVSELVKSGVSTKGENRGLGLSNIEELKQQYPQLLTEFHMIENLFSVTVYILDLNPIQIIDEDDEWEE